MVEAVETQEQPFTEEDASQMHEKVRELAQQHYTDKEELERWLGKLDSELQEISGLQERGNHLQGALEELQGEGAEEEGLGGEGECTVEDLQIAY